MAEEQAERRITLQGDSVPDKLGYIASFEDYLRERDRGEKTRAAYIGDLKRFIDWFEGSSGHLFGPAAVTTLDLAEYRGWLQRSGKKPASVNRALAAIRAFFDYARDAGLVEASPAVKLRRVGEEPRAPRSLDRRQQQALARAVQKYGSLRDQAVITLLLHTGLRVSELAGLKPEDVRREGSVWVLVVRAGKGNKRREVPLNDTAKGIMERLLKETTGDLFASRKHGPLSVRAVQRMLNKYARIAGLENVTPHVLRHTFAKNLIDMGESIDRVAALLGHANLNTTARYTRPTLGDLEKAVQRVAWR